MTDPTTTDVATTDKPTTNKPIKVFENGNLQVVIFNNKLDEIPDKYVIKIDKRTKKPGENYHRSTRYYVQSELAMLAQLATEAEAYVKTLPS